MPQKPNDRTKEIALDKKTEPKIYIIVDGKKLPKPALETYFAKPVEGTTSATNSCSCEPVVGAYCSCNKVCTCVPVCGCVGHTACSCDSHQSRSGGCRCAPVH